MGSISHCIAHFLLFNAKVCAGPHAPTTILLKGHNMDFMAGFWNILWWTIWVFAFIAYLFALFAIIGDLFRDDKLNGWWKAVWIVFLIFVPFLTALIYLIARGSGMAKRSAADAAAAQSATAEYIRQTAGSAPSASDEIAKAKSLLDAGTITDAEYAQLKARALSAQA